MLDHWTQDRQPIAVRTPLGGDAFLLEGFTAVEAISEPYRLDLDLLLQPILVPPADRDALFARLLGQPVTVELRQPRGARLFHGIVARLAEAGQVRASRGGKPLTRYQARVVPRLWLLNHKTQSRAFQQVSVPEILEAVFLGDWGLDLRLELTGTFHPRDWCVQYRESDFAFVSRLMEEEGIFYFFRHDEGREELVVANTAASHPEAVDDGLTVPFRGVAGGLEEERVETWVKSQEVRSGRVTLWDQCFELPSNNGRAFKTLESTHTVTNRRVRVGEVEHDLSAGGAMQLERYDYPGDFVKRFDGVAPAGADRPADLERIPADGLRTARLRLERESLPGIGVAGSGNCRAFAAGHRFNLTDHVNADGEYVLTRVEHEAANRGVYTSEKDRPQVFYKDRFACIPLDANLPFRPAATTPRPRIEGVQTAVVTGVPGEPGPFVDKYGRVKVLFHWDRQGRFDGGSSCWVRVAQFWAGNGWGAFFWPRPKHEVVVAFEDGDPDRPLIVGSVYNAANLPPFPLPEKVKLAGIKSATVGGNVFGPDYAFNGIAFHDVPGYEQLILHTKRDLHLSADHNLVYMVGNHLIQNVANNTLDVNGGTPVG